MFLPTTRLTTLHFGGPQIVHSNCSAACLSFCATAKKGLRHQDMDLNMIDGGRIFVNLEEVAGLRLTDVTTDANGGLRGR